MIGGAPFLMPELTKELKKKGFDVVCAFSLRESEEVVNQDGSVEKKSVFKHKGFVSM